MSHGDSLALNDLTEVFFPGEYGHDQDANGNRDTVHTDS